ncbi:MAG: PmoA family protein, partial [Planctomycetota bacterium]
MTAAWTVASYLVLVCATQAVELSVERTDRGAAVKVDGRLFAEYLTDAKHQPAVWPIVGPTGQPMTRSFPLGPLLADERDDHPHHHSLWFAHEDVNGHNFWLEPKPGVAKSAANVIKHQEFLDLSTDGDRAIVITHNHWLAGESNLICEDKRTLVFGAEADARWIDFTIEIMATNGPVTFGDIKDGTFSTRVAGSMKVDAGGTLVNSRGQQNKDAWGMPAAWIDNYGILKGQTVGLAMFSHPNNFRHPTRWHVRNYGLLCANPFGDRQFPKADIKQAGYTVAEGEVLKLRYAVYLHRGDTAEGRVEEAFQAFAAEQDAGAVQSDDSAIVFAEDFEQGMDRWVVSDSASPSPVWSLEHTDDHGQVMRVGGKSDYKPPHRSPHSIALIKDVVVSDFELTAKLQNTNVNAGNHRDLCFFWGYQDPAHFYYVHLGAKPDPHSSQIFIVNDAPRTKITSHQSPGIPWTDGWHDVKVKHDVETGEVQV